MVIISKISRALTALICTILFACEKGNDTYLITATASQDAVDAGMEILKDGGSAMDAALSVALSEIAVTGGKAISYAGVLNLVYFEATTGKIHNMNAAFNTVQNETDPSTIPKVHFQTPTEYLVNGRTILVPGFIKGVEEAHRKFGKIPFKNIFDHAISVAEDGIIWSNQDQKAFNSSRWIVTKYPESRALFTKPDGTFYRAGELFRQPALAKTLKRLRSEGSDYMYKGEWAKKFVSSARKIGSKITLEDLNNYEVIWSKPVHGEYHGYDIYVHGEPAFGGINLVELLNLAEVSKLSEFGHYAKSPKALATLSQISKVSMYSNFKPDFFSNNIDLSNESRLTKATSKAIWEYMLNSDSVEITPVENYENEHSAAIVAVDKWGNMVALLHSINTRAWGANGLFVDGISIPDAAGHQHYLILKTGPGKDFLMAQILESW